jgi:hypothetical protein
VSDVADGRVRQIEDPVDEVALARFQDSLLVPGIDEAAKLIFHEGFALHRLPGTKRARTRPEILSRSQTRGNSIRWMRPMRGATMEERRME